MIYSEGFGYDIFVLAIVVSNLGGLHDCRALYDEGGPKSLLKSK